MTFLARGIARLKGTRSIFSKAGLSAINMSDDLAIVLKEDQSTLPYWLHMDVFVILVKDNGE